MKQPHVVQWLNDLWGRIGAPAGASIAADIAAITTSVGQRMNFNDYWCETPQATVIIPAVAADLDFSNVVLPIAAIPADSTDIRAFLMLKWRKQVDSSGAPNAINGVAKTIRIKISGGAWGVDDLVGITFADNQLTTAASGAEGGDMIVGSHDIHTILALPNLAARTFNIRSEQTNRADAILVDGASLTLYDVYTGIRVYFQ